MFSISTVLILSQLNLSKKLNDLDGWVELCRRWSLYVNCQHNYNSWHALLYSSVHTRTNFSPFSGGLKEGKVNDSAPRAHQFNSTRSQGRKSFEEVPQSLQTEAASFSVICYHVACLFTVSTNSS